VGGDDLGPDGKRGGQRGGNIPSLVLASDWSEEAMPRGGHALCRQ
jgi:hypothetical protein